jgi:hypothetical protein
MQGHLHTTKKKYHQSTSRSIQERENTKKKVVTKAIP